MERHRVQVTVRGVVLHEGKLLCVKLKPYEGTITKSAGYWCIPGGHLDGDEALVDCCRREMLEETGVEAQVGNLLYVQQFAHEGEEYIEFFFEITNSEDYLEIDLSKSTHGETEIAEVEFINPAGQDVLPRFFTTEPLAEHAASYTGPKFFSYLG